MTNLNLNSFKPGDHFMLQGIEYKKLQLRRSSTHGRVNVQNTATYEKRYIPENVIVEPLTESYQFRITPIMCRYYPNMR